MDLAKVKRELLDRKKNLEEILVTMSKERVSDDQVQDPGDQAQSLIMESLRNSLQDAEHEEYMRITKALAAIETGQYGVCVDCGAPIPEKRLKYYPDATRCLACQEAFEQHNT